MAVLRAQQEPPRASAVVDRGDRTIEVDFREEISLDDLGLAPAPIYTARV